MKTLLQYHESYPENLVFLADINVCLCSLSLFYFLLEYIDFLILNHSFLKRFYLFIFRARGREGEKEGEKHPSAKETLVASQTPPVGDLACHPGLCPARESNQQPFSLWDYAWPTEPHQSGHVDPLSQPGNRLRVVIAHAHTLSGFAVESGPWRCS